MFLSSACAVVHTGSTVRIALLAPFEGRYREIGYNALYAARLALKDSGMSSVELLPIDDGGTAESAADRARAFVSDPSVKIAIALGYAATDAETQRAFGDIPVLIAGHWDTQPQAETVFMLSSCELDVFINAPQRIEVTEAAKLNKPVVGGEVFALEQFPKLRESLDGITIVSSASLPDADFTEHYRASDQFVPEPGLLATLVYDAGSIATQAVSDTSKTRKDIQYGLNSIAYSGLNGNVRFESGCWQAAPIHKYIYNSDRQLIPVNDIVKQR